MSETVNSVLKRVLSCRCKKFHAFTLAEILITIGIIGVVAAITIPLLMQNSNSKKFTTQFKKSLSTLNQAAIGAQAQYDLDYSLLTQINDDATCKSNTLAGGQYNFCGLFNNTLAGQTYLGKYGNVKGANASSPYSADVTSFSIEDFLFFSFADGAIVAFNPNAKSCGIGVGQTLTNEKLTSSLANCIGFIDVNGPTPPNKEVQCAEGTTTISANTTCKVTNGSMGDIFPVVFHDGAVEPATNASLAAFLGGNGKEEKQVDPFDGNYFTDQNGNKRGFKLVTDEDGNVSKYNGWDLKDGSDLCPSGTSIPDSGTLQNLVQQNLGEVTYKSIFAPENPWYWKYEYTGKEKGALGLPTSGYFWTTESENGSGHHNWGISASSAQLHGEHKNNQNAIICVESK